MPNQPPDNKSGSRHRQRGEEKEAGTGKTRSEPGELSGRSHLAPAVARLRGLSAAPPALALVLGSGFGGVVNYMEIDARVPYATLPGFPPVGVSGHAGELILGRLGGAPVAVLNGRAHFYEGHSMAAVTFGIRLLAEFGVRDVLLTNAAGGIRRSFEPGDFMIVTDHLNFMGTNPLRGGGEAGLSRFVELSQAYDPALRQLLLRAGRRCRLKLKSGVYMAVSGPSYETPAEIRAFGRLGADAVGMSTVPEVIVGRQSGLNMAAISCITNLAAGRTSRALSHQEVLETAERVQPLAAKLLMQFAELHRERENMGRESVG